MVGMPPKMLLILFLSLSLSWLCMLTGTGMDACFGTPDVWVFRRHSQVGRCLELVLPASLLPAWSAFDSHGLASVL